MVKIFFFWGFLFLLVTIYQHNKIIMLSHKLQEEAAQIYLLQNQLQESRAQLYKILLLEAVLHYAQEHGLQEIAARQFFCCVPKKTSGGDLS